MIELNARLKVEGEPETTFPVRMKDDLLVDPQCIPAERIARLLDTQRSIQIDLLDQSMSLMPSFIVPSYAKLFMLELEPMLRQLKSARYVEWYPSADELWLRTLSDRVRDKVCAFLNNTVHAIRVLREYNAQGKLEYVAKMLDYREDWSDSTVKALFESILLLDLQNQLNPALDILRKLRESLPWMKMAFGFVSFRADELLPYIENDQIYIEWCDEYTRYLASCFSDFSSRLRIEQSNGVTSLIVTMNPQWDHRDDGIQVSLHYNYVGDRRHAPFVTYELDDDGNFTASGLGKSLDVKWESNEDIKCDGSPLSLHIPLLDVETLDMMAGTPVRFREYFLYSGFSEVTYPVSIRLVTPMEAMYVLDRLATMLTSNMIITDVEMEVNDGYGGKKERRVTHPWILTSLISQVVFQQRPPKTLNEFAYRLLKMAKSVLPMESHPWRSFTLEGHRDELSIASMGSPPILARSHPSLSEYIKERRALMCAVNWSERDGSRYLGLMPV